MVRTNRNTANNKKTEQKTKIKTQCKGNQCTNCVEKRPQKLHRAEWLRKCETMKENGGKK